MPEITSATVLVPDNAGRKSKYLRIELEFGTVINISILGRANHEARIELFDGDLAVEFHHEGTFARIDTGNIEEKQS